MTKPPSINASVCFRPQASIMHRSGTPRSTRVGSGKTRPISIKCGLREVNQWLCAHAHKSCCNVSAHAPLSVPHWYGTPRVVRATEKVDPQAMVST